MLEQDIHIVLRLRLTTGKVSLNEIVYLLRELRNPLMLQILQTILAGYHDLICELCKQTQVYDSFSVLAQRIQRVLVGDLA